MRAAVNPASDALHIQAAASENVLAPAPFMPTTAAQVPGDMSPPQCAPAFGAPDAVMPLAAATPTSLLQDTIPSRSLHAVAALLPAVTDGTHPVHDDDDVGAVNTSHAPTGSVAGIACSLLSSSTHRCATPALTLTEKGRGGGRGGMYRRADSQRK